MRNGTQCVVTGLGSICANGADTELFWNNSVNGHCGIKPISTDKLACDIPGWYGEAEESIPLARSGKKVRRMDRTSLLCMKAVEEAIIQSGIEFSKTDRRRVGVVMGSCTGGPGSAEHYLTRLRNGKRLSPYEVLNIPIHAIAGYVAGYYDLNGSVTNIANACAAGAMSIAYGCDLIRYGLADVVIAGGADAFAKLQFGGFYALKALDASPCSPFSRSEGISLGEGAGVLIIESLQHAADRGADIVAEVLGYGITSDAYHITAPRPDGEGQITAIHLALDEAGLSTTDISYLNAHGTGTPLNDTAEQTALRAVFSPEDISISSTKSMIGHCLGAAGSLEAVITIKALQNQQIPPTIHFNSDKKSRFNFVPNTAQNVSIEYAMSNSFAFGGNNASLIFGKNTHNNVNKSLPNVKVYITGLGIISSQGDDIHTYWKNMNEADKGEVQSCLVPDTYLASEGISPAYTRRMDRLSKLLLFSGLRAIKDSGLEMDEERQRDTGLIVGTSDGPADEIRSFLEQLLAKGIQSGSPMLFPNTVYNAAAAQLSIHQRIQGCNMTVTNGISSGMDCISDSFEIVKSNRHQVMLAAGVDEYSDTIHQLYDTLRALNRHTDTSLSKPYAFTGKGFSLAEGAATLVLESEDHAYSRGASLYAEVAGYGRSYQYCTPGKVDPEAAALDHAILQACAMSGILPENIEAIVGFANGDSLIDGMELCSYARVFGRRAQDIPVYAIKSRLGEGRAGISSLQVAHAAMLLATGERPVPQRGAPFPSVESSSGSTQGFHTILVTSFSFGGSFSAMILKDVPNRKGVQS
ncbi:beta-ketoacyl-[acyl-carrier-protein] synthase family protein [Paenibacillus tritici]|uniref:beta-ketoacyl-[acyl-carrier-protein] synthase family protein n=1 Tax=Paenibacillus tritici TaxID=1873425 RepID=UPI001BAA4014|nr:beta-ketoacyl-[acyl-carrier-protein] synthase family protein [Paenibacillus tritici]QUL55898.1 beta-ketoacyl-[acyl-carrier-protein] synthase family protein [Paenibacillus tritici]